MPSEKLILSSVIDYNAFEDLIYEIMKIKLKFHLHSIIFAILNFIFLIWFVFISPVLAISPAQQPTGELPTVTSTPRGPYVVVNPITATDNQINVRAGPNALTEKVGVLLINQQANALGRYGDWIQIEYPGAPGGKAWVYANLVTLYGGNIPLIEPPPTSTPRVTQTIDPTLAAQFLVTPNTTRMPTFTEPAPLEIPTFDVGAGTSGVGVLPMGLIIIGLGALGLFLAVIALISGR